MPNHSRSISLRNSFRLSFPSPFTSNFSQTAFIWDGLSVFETCGQHIFNIYGGNKIENLCYLYFLHQHLCKFLFGDESILIDVKKSESNVCRILSPSFALDRIYLLELTLSTFSFSNYFIYQVHLLTGQLCQLFLFRERVKKW